MPIAQGYLAVDADSEVRLRRAGENCYLTVKQGRGESRQETEVEIDPETFETLWPRTADRRIEKSRRTIELAGGVEAEADRYTGELEGLAVVEVEFESEAAAVRFVPPGWFGREVTGDPAWANQTLAARGKPDRELEFRLRSGEDPGHEIARLIAARTAQAAAAVRRAGEGSDPGADQVHRARKSVKKARSALRLLRGVISDDERRTANGDLRKAARALSAARDSEVKVETLEKVGNDRSEPYGQVLWQAQLEKEAETRRGELTGERLAGIAASIDSVGRLYRDRRIHDRDEQIAANLTRSYGRGRRAKKKAGKSDDPEDFHAWRRRAKDLRYQLEMLGPQLPEEFDRTRQQARELSERLGELHDLDLLGEDLAGREIDHEHRRVLGERIDRARVRLVEDCLERGESIYSRKPGRFATALDESPDPPR